MANRNFVVHNGLEVGAVTIFSGNGDIITGGNLTSTGSATIQTVSVTRYLMQLPASLAGPTWYKLGTLRVTSGAGLGEVLEIAITGGQGYATSVISKDIIVCRINNGSSTNLRAQFYSLGYRAAILDVKATATVGTATTWDIYALVAADVGNGIAEIKVNNNANFAWAMTSASDPGVAAANLVVADNKLVTSTANVNIVSGNLYVGGNIYQGGVQVGTASSSNGWSTEIVTPNNTTGPFTLSKTPADIDQIAVWWNGIFQPKSTYSLTTNQLQFSEAPPAGSTVEVKILGGTGAQNLSTLKDINFTSAPTDGQFLAFNSATQQWGAATSATSASVTRNAITYAVVLGGL